ncbi:zinc finger, CCHC-type containing protein [Tanacetum coccineum]
MGDENPIRTLGDYSKPSHEGYRNTIELPVGNNVVPLRSDTIRLVQNGCSFHGLRSEDPNQHLKDFLKLVDSLDLDGENRERTRLRLFQFSLRDQASNWLERLPAGSITTWEDLTTRFLAQFFPPGRTAKLRNDILIGDEERSDKNNVAIRDNTEKPTETEMKTPAKKAEKGKEAESKAENEETTEAPSSQPVEYYLKHRINEKLIEGLVDNHRKEDIGGNFKIPCNIVGISEDILVKVAEHVYPVDFVILDIKEDEKRPFILGTPFLTRAKAVIKFIEIASLAINRKHGLMTFTDGTKEVTFKTPYKDLERSELSSEGHDLLSSRVNLSEDDYDRGCRKPSDLEDGFYKDTIKLRPEYLNGMDDEGEVTKFLIKNEDEIFTDARDGVRIIPDGVASLAM